MRKPCLQCGPKVCGEYWLYVVADKDGSGPVKVGISRRPVRRLAQHRKKTKRDLSIHLKLPFKCEFKAMDAEDSCLTALQASRVYGDWFDLPIERVLDVVKRSVGRG